MINELLFTRRCPRRIASFFLLLAGVTAIYLMEGKRDMPNSEPHKTRIALRETVRNFSETNNIPLLVIQRASGYFLDKNNVADTTSLYLEGMITLQFEDGPQGFTLPSGQILTVSQVAGNIKDFTMTLFDVAKPLDYARNFLKEFIVELDQKEWRAEGGINIPNRPNDLERSGIWTIVARMTDRHSNRLELSIIDYGLAPKQESWITVPLGRSNKASDTYLVQVSVFQPAGTLRNYGDAVYPRRLFVNGSIKAALPLRAWIEDPDWSPAAHGMVPVPESERDGDVSYWRMPR